MSKERAKATGGVIYATQQSGYVRSLSSKASEFIVMPARWLELGGEMVFITSRRFLTEEDLRFTDVGLLRLRARRSFGKGFELYAGTQLLAKQPSTTDEPVWQGGLIGARTEFAKGFASSLTAGGGPLLGDSGWWWQAEPSLMAKAKVTRHVRFVLNMGTSLTVIDRDERTEQPFWLEELAAGAEAQLGDRDGGLWVRLDYHLPLASNPEPDRPDGVTGEAFDPQVRLNFQVGGVLTLWDEGWDLFATYSWSIAATSTAHRRRCPFSTAVSTSTRPPSEFSTASARMGAGIAKLLESSLARARTPPRPLEQ
jgi:hypothetical protein